MNFSNSTHLATVLGGALVFLIALAVLPTVLQQFNQSKVMVGADGHCQYLGERFRSISYVKDDFQAALDLEDNSGDCALPSGTVLGAGDLYTPNGNIVPRGIGGGTTPVRQTGLNLTTSGIVGGSFILPSASYEWFGGACSLVGFTPALYFGDCANPRLGRRLHAYAVKIETIIDMLPLVILVAGLLAALQHRLRDTAGGRHGDGYARHRPKLRICCFRERQFLNQRRRQQRCRLSRRLSMGRLRLYVYQRRHTSRHN